VKGYYLKLLGSCEHYTDILRADNFQVNIQKSTLPWLNVDFKTVNNMDSVLCPRLKAKSSGNWTLTVGVAPVTQFSTRWEFDDCFLTSYDYGFLHLRPDIPYLDEESDIPIRKVFEAAGVELSIDMECIAANGGAPKRQIRKIKKYLKSCSDPNSELKLKRLEAMFFYEAMTELFGSTNVSGYDSIPFGSGESEECHTVKSYMVTDYKLHRCNGNFTEVTCRQGDYYMYFGYSSS